MKKVVLLLIIAYLIVFLGTCNTKHLTNEQSKKNFVTYENYLQEIAKNYDLELVETIAGYNSKKFYIIISETAKIQISMTNSAGDSDDTGVERFCIDYILRNMKSQSKNEFNVELFVDLVNCISGKKLSVDFCNEFLEAPESDYAAEDHGFRKLNGEIIAKRHNMNFFEDWNIYYYLYSEEEELSYTGLTLQLEDTESASH